MSQCRVERDDEEDGRHVVFFFGGLATPTAPISPASPSILLPFLFPLSLSWLRCAVDGHKVAAGRWESSMALGLGFYSGAAIMASGGRRGTGQGHM